MKTLVITGGSKGIGLATARLFAAEGYRVVNISRSPIALAGAVQLGIDIAEPDWAARHGEAVRAAVAGSETIALVHNAGLLTKDSVANVDAAALHRVLQVNVVACVQLDQLLLPLMGAGSAIVYVGSTLGEKAVAGSCAYVVSKHALIGLMRATCQDLAGRGIHTACVCPGFTDTEMLRAHVGQASEVLEALAGNVTFGRLIEPEEVARTIHFCALNAVINGAVIHANLGQFER
ncbi:MAG: SDR family oxidoreductase [Gammaproteobacteria bacterium]|jgi:3-oxoacyl-[acyl-carrier protein] reductase|nr:SDR family oxidoreductase [Gammaproteobacteria bacterium]MBP6479699.1 SDR family oxidoreductase [Pseudomonadales bacterium]MBP7910909.1 SDR family oxidoreductase [Pseudomonadales bacterium]